jgi:hypothetical protein
VDVAISFEKKTEPGEELKPYVHISGFKTHEDWINAIHKVNPKMKTGVEGYLYIVAKLYLHRKPKPPHRY